MRLAVDGAMKPRYLSSAALFVVLLVSSSASAQAPDPPAPRRERRSVPLMIAGIIVTAAGAASAGIGTVFVGSAATCRETVPRSAGPCKDNDLKYSLAALWLTGGVVGLGAGIPMTIVGAWKVPQADTATGAIPAVAVGPGVAKLSWRF